MLKSLIEKLEKFDAALDSAERANAAQRARLESLTEQISKLESKPEDELAENLDAIRELTALREQRRLLSQKLTSDCEKRLKSAKAESGFDDDRITSFLRERLHELKDQIGMSVRHYLADSGKVARFVDSCDSVLLMQRIINSYGDSGLPDRLRISELLEILRKLHAGQPMWIFKSE